MTRRASIGDFLSQASFWKADYLQWSAWLEHAPLAFWLVDALRPTTFVELGTHTGFSYLSLCQAVDRLEIPSKGFAVDTWKGDEQTGFYGEEVFAELVAYHDPRYSAFSRLLRSTFDEAVGYFEDDSIDLLHIDGLHTYEAVRHDFDTWQPKLSPRGVVLFHDTNVRERGFGVHRLWAELRTGHPGFEFVHGHGLGVLGVGKDLPSHVSLLLETEASPTLTAEIRQVYARLGGAIRLEVELGDAQRLAELERSEMADKLEAREAEVAALEEKLLAREAEFAALEEKLVAELSAQAEQEAAHRARAELLENQLALVLSSESWRLTAPLRSVGRWVRRAAEGRQQIATRTGVLDGDRELVWYARHRRLVAITTRIVPPSMRRHLRERFPGATAAVLHPRILSPTRQKAVLFVSGAPEVAKRYRCDHQAEQLELLGASVDVAPHGDVDLPGAAADYRAFVLHRVPWGRDVEIFLDRVRALGGVVVFDTDDLVFDPEVMPDVAALADMPPDEVRLYEEGLHRYRRTLQACDAVTVSTEPLAELARALHDKVVVAPNVASVAMVEAAESALHSASACAQQESGDPQVTIGYLSGTNTHRMDFLEAADALLTVLESSPQTRLLVVGPLTLDHRFDRFEQRIERLPFQPWARLPEIQASVDINLAPLEANNPFTDSKSCVKWIEGSLVGVPTVASPRSDFRRVIDDGENGMLAEGPDEWERALVALVDDPERRRRIGMRARQDALRLHTSKALASSYHETFRGLLPDQRAPLTINWIMQAPIARNSGGYRNIFRIAAELGSRGNVQRLCVNPVAHLSGLSDRQVRNFVDEAFGIPANSEVVVGHSLLAPADVSIATFWSTAPTVAAHDRSLFKAYFIQDFEPEFYERGDPLYAEAARTYELPLRHICLGAHLGNRVTEVTGLPADVVDFALDPAFRLTTPPEDRGEPVRVLFFARPSLRRRGYELGLEALRLIKEAHPEVDIVFFGTSSDELGPVPFEMRNLGILDAAAVAEAMNASHILLAFSLTNISNVPFEGMACGCAVVDVDLPSVATMVEPGRNCLLAPLEPGAIARSVIALVEDRDLRVRLGKQGATDRTQRTWARTARMFEDILTRACFARLPRPQHALAAQGRAA